MGSDPFFKKWGQKMGSDPFFLLLQLSDQKMTTRKKGSDPIIKEKGIRPHYLDGCERPQDRQQHHNGKENHNRKWHADFYVIDEPVTARAHDEDVCRV